MKYTQGRTYSVKLRSLEWLKRVYQTEEKYGELSIYHSAGGGGGLHIKKRRLFGSDIKVIFQRNSGGRNIFSLESSFKSRYPQQFYDEWFVMEDEIDSILPGKLFEI